MRTSEGLNLAYFASVTILALLWPLPGPSRIKALVCGVMGLGLTAIGAESDGRLATDTARALHDWLPVPAMALAYWQSGCFFDKANPRLQVLFERSDRALLRVLHIDAARWARRRIGGLLELAYVFCYPVVPLGILALYASGLRHRVDDYWTVVLLAAYPCYALLPFVQLLPPRLVSRQDESPVPDRTLRRFNLWLARRVTHEANTFPSGHVAASAAIALVLLDLTPHLGLVFLLIALGIAAGCIVGRYHYAVDVAAAFVLAGAAFAVSGGS
jgi:membrane-associated phospholipid phosphatase